MDALFTRSLKNKLIQLLLLSLPLLSRAQTVIVNYDFNSLTANSTYPVPPATTAVGISSAATSTEQLATVAGVATGTGAYAINSAGPALNMPNSSGNNRYFQFELGGADLFKYTAFKIYLQGQRSGTGATTLTLQYSVNGGGYTTFGPTYAPGNGSFTEGGFDLSGLPDLNNPSSLRFRLLASGASGNGSLRIDNFQVQAANTVDVLRWTGGAGTPSWADAGNWSTGKVPVSTDEVILDHLHLDGRYLVTIGKGTAASIKSLRVNPGAGDSILVEVPDTNTEPTALTLSNTGAGAVALAIYDKGVVTNASSGTTGIEIVGTGPTMFIYNGGSYRQAGSAKHAPVVENMSDGAGTERGIFDFRLPATGTRSYALSVSGRTYGTLILRSPSQVTTSYPAGSANFLTIRGNLLVGPGANFTPTVGDNMRVSGDIKVQGTMLISSSTAATTNQLLLASDKPQTISGNISFVTGTTGTGVGLAIDNKAGVTLATPLVLSGPLVLTNGLLTTTGDNLLTMSPNASIAGGSPTSYVNGPLARQTDAGPLNNLLFPIGSATAYRPLTLHATAQNATTYLVTQTEGPAPDFTNLPVSTSALPQLTRVSRARSYTITPIPIPAANKFSGTVTLAFGADDQVNAPTDGSFTIGKNSGSGWQNIGSSNVTVATPVPADGFVSGTITSDTFTSFSTFALASTSADATINPLPVVLVSFTARRRGPDVALNWATAVELHNARFAVQRSADGQMFTTVTTVAGHGTAATTRQYAALDPAAPAGSLYYRLAQVDESGATTFSPVVALAAATTATPYPNPAHDWLMVPAPAGTPVRVLDLLGRVVQSLALPPSGEVSVGALPTGSYVLQIGEEAQAQRFKFNKE